DHEETGPVRRSAVPGDESQRDPDAADPDHAEFLTRRAQLELVRPEHQRDVGRHEEHGGQAEHDHQEGAAGHGGCAAILASAGADNSALWMKPRADVRCNRCPNSAASRLEVSTTTGSSPLPANRSATTNPSMSGSITSSSTSPGRNRSTAASAELP